ncbi:uncharacterized protein PHALS_04917 [Plasmopara halstedii]|uniref:Uncharacterized protein n=1 Tax=Plasmopara halstedii TaxID=4781 RepID=A0A0N7L403_PLAHL|nr:uncharacterized protein PHALS_04917 [Plasmopara halstedii]CEG37315.1 hypothetical protein PHALS_04917 [Plasmopara halstedii]|eukprot:XP_024573684.1 hypothetical protein PHALS_04917 [Plasmopara halstedii]
MIKQPAKSKSRAPIAGGKCGSLTTVSYEEDAQSETSNSAEFYLLEGSSVKEYRFQELRLESHIAHPLRTSIICLKVAQ